MSAHKKRRHGSGAKGSQKKRKVNRNGWLSHDEQKHVRKRIAVVAHPNLVSEPRQPGFEQRRSH